MRSEGTIYKKTLRVNEVNRGGPRIRNSESELLGAKRGVEKWGSQARHVNNIFNG